MQRLPKASCGVLPVSVFRDARVNYVMRRLGEATDEFFEALMMKLQAVMPEASEEQRRAAMLEGLARTVPGWSAPVVNQRMQRLLELARDFEANMHAAFAIYVKDTYAEDLRGRKRKVQVCMPKLSAFLHMYFCRIVISPEVKRGAYFDRTSTVARNFAVSNAMLDALAEVCVENVRVVDVPSESRDSGPPRPSQRPANPYANPMPPQQQQQQQYPPRPSSMDSAAFDDASSFASMGESRSQISHPPPPDREPAQPRPPTAQSRVHPFDAFKAGGESQPGSRFSTFVPPVTSAAAAAPVPPPAPPKDADNASDNDNASVPSLSDSSTSSSSSPPPPPPRRSTSRAASRKTTASSAGALALLKKLQSDK
jgi:hypothetical protein